MNIPSLLADSPSMGRRDLDTQQAATPALELDYTDASASEYQRLYIPQEYTTGPGSSRNLPSIRTPAIKTTAPEPQIKLTPITGKISKAKKGMAVHTCDQCPKTFTRPEHLRRHKLTHAPPDLRCPRADCEKEFYRKDLFERHLQRHEQDDDLDLLDTLLPASRRPIALQSMPEMLATPSLPTQVGYLPPKAHSERNGEGHRFSDPQVPDDDLRYPPALIIPPPLPPPRYLPTSTSFGDPISDVWTNWSTPENLDPHDRIPGYAERFDQLAPPPLPPPLRMESFTSTKRSQFGSFATDTFEHHAKEALAESLYKRPQHRAVFCDQCQDHPEGFRGEHELRRHVCARHENCVKKFVCRDPVTVGLVSSVQPFVPLSKCKACIGGKKYGAYYNAAAHLRRSHFKPRKSRAKNDNSNNERRGGKGGGDWPAMADLKVWLTEVIVNLRPLPLDDEEYPYSDDGTADEFTMTQPMLSSISQSTKNSAEVKPGVPFTDSGYGSILNPNYTANDARPEATPQDAAEDTHADDAMTVYSAATTVTPHHAQQYISEFCDDLHSKFKQQIDAKTWKIVFQRLPELIKTFALRLGQESSSVKSRHIVYFLHKRHREIAKHMESVVSGAGGDVVESPKVDTEGMSLFDKMNMWNDRADESDKVANRDDCFEGVYDVDEEDIGQVDTSVYNETILNSAAYQWFIATIQKEQRIDRGGKEDRAVIDEIRKAIITRLPAACISKRRPVPSSVVAFRLEWWKLKPRLEAGRTRLGLSLGQCLSHVITVTGSSNGAQATTIRNYMSQTWPMSNAILLSALEHVVDDDQGTVYHAQLLDKTIIRVYIRGAYLLVAIRGPAQSNAECGEQLAWLAAGLSPSLGFNHCTSTITENDYDGYLNDLYPGCKVTTFDVSLQQSNVGSNLSKAPCLVRAVGNPSIVTGFPTARRPENFLGLEIDTELLLSIIKTTDDGLFWPGCGKRLAVFQQTDDVVLWHICHSASRPCLCCMRHCSLYPRGFLSIDSLRNCRHIVDLCGDSDHLLAEGQLRPSTKEDISRLMMENQPEHDDNDAYFKDTSWSGSSSHLRTGADSTDASFESDLFSDSGSSEVYEPLDSSDQDFPALNRVLQTLLSGFRESCQVRKRPGQSETSSGTGSETFRPLRAAISTNSSSHPCRKRQHQQSDDEGSGNEDMPPPDKRAALPQGKRRRQQLACPFWKRNPGQHRACFSKTLRRIRDVKQHLTRKHTPEFYCECCCATFDNEDSHRRHVTHVSGEVCVHDPTVVLDGISHQQHRRLSKKSDFKFTDQEQWFSVWDILFPGSQRPDSAYLDFGLSEETSSFREYCFQYGPATLEQALADEIPEVERRQHLIRICQTGYNQLFEAWYSSRDSRETSSRNGSSTTSQSGTRLPQCQPTPSSSLDNSFLTRENPALVDPQSQYSVPNPDMDQSRPPCAWNDASQLPLGTMASGDFQISDQDLPNMNPNIPLQSWSGAGETSTVQFIFDPIVRSSAGLNLGDLQIDGGMDFSSFLNYAGDTNPNQ